ncbi:hypothetical protein EVAR_17106_1 [Eumeta japonica]|uniref:Uncharacterized protein n=1 Tax=Eumeta variegata TaxID=151549 RepID=A0A4C1UN40_EUMVA|nr:hypothetical protein EVAR_17106_1 [Eumeta japonica]
MMRQIRMLGDGLSQMTKTRNEEVLTVTVLWRGGPEAKNSSSRYGTFVNRCSERMWRSSVQHIARRMYDIADQDTHGFLRNIAPMHKRSPSELLKEPSKENSSRRPLQPKGKAWSAEVTRDGISRNDPR